MFIQYDAWNMAHAYISDLKKLSYKREKCNYFSQVTN